MNKLVYSVGTVQRCTIRGCFRDLLTDWVAATGDDDGYGCRRSREQGLESEYICTKAETAEGGEATNGVLKPAKAEDLTPAVPIMMTDTLEREPCGKIIRVWVLIH
jgi:hypothetical protein